MNRKTINHLFKYVLDETFGKRIYVVFQSSDDITSKQIKSALKKYDGWVDSIPSSELRFMRVLTNREWNEYQSIMNEYTNEKGSLLDVPQRLVIDFAEFQNYAESH